jgi:hypothetical protein
MKIKYLYIFVVVLIAQKTVEAQTLKRKAMLGVMMQTLTDSIALENDLDIENGVYINDVMPNSTFSNLGVKEGDVLIKINRESVKTVQEVLLITGKLYEDDVIEIEFYSNRGLKKASTHLLSKPIETFLNGDVFYDEVVYDGNILRNILVTPKSNKRPPVVYFLQGYTCSSIEIVSNDSPMKKLMEDWLDAGFAIYRIEKPGVGDSKSNKHCIELDFNEELKAFEQGYINLLKIDTVDTDNIFLFGHSMGGVIAPVLNNIHTPRGIMVYGTVGKNWHDYMVDLYTKQPKHFGVSEEQIREDSRVNLKFNEDLLIRKLNGAEILKNKDYVNFFNAEDLKRNQYLGRHLIFWQTLADIKVQDVWSKINTNVLAMHGEFDIQAINPQGAQKIVEVVNSNKGMATFLLIKNADHGFVNFKTMQQNVEVLNNGTYRNHAQNNYSIMLGEESVNWMRYILNQ